MPLGLCRRRQKRIKMRERNMASIWRVTPSPPPEERARLQAKLAKELQRQHEEEAAKVAAAHHHHHHHHWRAKKEEAGDGAEASGTGRQGDEAAADPELLALQSKEVALFEVGPVLKCGLG